MEEAKLKGYQAVGTARVGRRVCVRGGYSDGEVEIGPGNEGRVREVTLEMSKPTPTSVGLGSMTLLLDFAVSGMQMPVEAQAGNHHNAICSL